MYKILTVNEKTMVKTVFTTVRTRKQVETIIPTLDKMNIIYQITKTK